MCIIVLEREREVSKMKFINKLKRDCIKNGYIIDNFYLTDELLFNAIKYFNKDSYYNITFWNDGKINLVEFKHGEDYNCLSIECEISEYKEKIYKIM
jgi:hypothetical protein